MLIATILFTSLEIVTSDGSSTGGLVPGAPSLHDHTANPDARPSTLTDGFTGTYSTQPTVSPAAAAQPDSAEDTDPDVILQHIKTNGWISSFKKHGIIKTVRAYATKDRKPAPSAAAESGNDLPRLVLHDESEQTAQTAPAPRAEHPVVKKVKGWWNSFTNLFSRSPQAATEERRENLADTDFEGANQPHQAAVGELHAR